MEHMKNIIVYIINIFRAVTCFSSSYYVAVSLYSSYPSRIILTRKKEAEPPPNTRSEKCLVHKSINLPFNATEI